MFHFGLQLRQLAIDEVLSFQEDALSCDERNHEMSDEDDPFFLRNLRNPKDTNNSHVNKRVLFKRTLNKLKGITIKEQIFPQEKDFKFYDSFCK